MLKSLFNGVFWNGMSLFVSKGLTFLIQLILANLLVPEHFGIIGMALVFTNLLMVLGEMGMASALIQRKENITKHIHYHTAFWSSLLLNVVLYVLTLVLVAPFAVWFYDEPVLFGVIAVLSINMLLRSFMLIPEVLLTKQLNFRTIGLITIVSSVIGGISGILFAFSGFGVWSLVLMTLITSLTGVPIYWVTVKWRPSLQFSVQALRDIFGKGAFDTLQRFFSALSQNLDYLLIGRILDAQLLGFYTLAFIITDVFRQQIMSVLNKVLFPIYGKMQEDRGRIKLYYLQVIKFNTLAVVGVMLPLMVLAEPFIHVAVGEDWSRAVFPLQALAVASIVHSIGGSTDSVLKGLGEFQLNFRLFMIKTFLVTAPALLIGTYFFGINGAAVAVIAQKLFTRLLYQFYMRKLIRVKESDILRTLFPSLIGAAVILPVLWWIYTADRVTDIYTLVLYFMGVILLYFAVTIWLLRSDIAFAIRTIRS
jgi:teichuronic acid exporter